MAVERFNASYYLEKNPDVVAAVARGIFKDAEDHFRKFGAAEGRRPNADFDPAYYAVNNLDVLAAVNKKVFATVFDHYLNHGFTEIKLGEKTEGAEKAGKAFRAPTKEVAALIETFDGDAYLKAHPDVKGYDAKTAIKHYLDKGKDLGYKPTVRGGGDGGPTTPGNSYTTTGSPVVLTSGAAPVGAVVVSETNQKGLTSDADTIYVAGDAHLDGARIEDATAGDGDRLVVTLENSVTPASVKNIETFDIRVKGTSGSLDFSEVYGTKKVNLSGAGTTKLTNVESGIEYTLTGDRVIDLTIQSGARNTDKDAATLTLKGGVGGDSGLALNLGGSEKDDIDHLTINNSGANKVKLNTLFTKDESITIKGTSGLELKSIWANVKDTVLKAEGTTYTLEITDALTNAGVAPPGGTAANRLYLTNNLSGFDQLTLSTPTGAGTRIADVFIDGISTSVKTINLAPANGTGAITGSGGGITLTGKQYTADGTQVKDDKGKQVDNWSKSDDALTVNLKGTNIGGKLSVEGIETLTIDGGDLAHTIGGLGLSAGATLKLLGSGLLTLGVVTGGGNTIDASGGGGVKLELSAPPAGLVNGSLYSFNTVITSNKADEITLSAGRDVIVFNSTKGGASFVDASGASTAAVGYDLVLGTLSSADDRVRFSGDYSFTGTSTTLPVKLGGTGGTVSFADSKAVTMAAGVAADELTDLTKVLDAIGGGTGAASGKLADNTQGHKGLILIKGGTKTGIYYVNNSHGATAGSAADTIIQADEIKLVGVFDGDLTVATSGIDKILTFF